MAWKNLTNKEKREIAYSIRRSHAGYPPYSKATICNCSICKKIGANKHKIPFGI